MQQGFRIFSNLERQIFKITEMLRAFWLVNWADKLILPREIPCYYHLQIFYTPQLTAVYSYSTIPLEPAFFISVQWFLRDAAAVPTFWCPFWSHGENFKLQYDPTFFGDIYKLSSGFRNYRDDKSNKSYGNTGKFRKKGTMIMTTNLIECCRVELWSRSCAVVSVFSVYLATKSMNTFGRPMWC